MSQGLGKAFGDSDELTHLGIPKSVFVSDFHGTIVDGSTIRKDYMQALIKMHVAGHIVMIASGDRDNAQTLLDNDPVIDEIFDALNLSDEKRGEIRSSLLRVGDKDNLKELMLSRGVVQRKLLRPDVFCDDDKPMCLPKIHLDPNTPRFDAFVSIAKNDPNGALDMLLDEEVSVREIGMAAKSVDKIMKAYDAIEGLRKAYPLDANSLFRFSAGLTPLLPLSDDAQAFLKDAGFAVDLSHSHEPSVHSLLENIVAEFYQGADKPVADPFAPHEIHQSFNI